MNYLGDFPTGKTIFIPFHTFNSSGASVTITGLAVTDIEVYKGASMTQRSSDAGYALADTDGIDLDGVTGIHGFTIDTSDNTDAGFYAVGNDYTVVVSSITADGQTVNFIAAQFSIANRCVNLDSIVLTNGASAFGIQASGTLSGTHSTTTADLGTNAPSVDISGMTLFIPVHGLSAIIDSYNTGTGVATFSPATAATLANGNPWFVAGTPKGSTGSPLPVNATQFAGQTITAAAGVTLPSSVASPTNITAGTITTVTNLTNAPTSGDLTATMKTSVGTAVAASAVASVTGNVGGNVTGSVGSVVGAVGSVTGNVGGNVVGTVAGVTPASAASINATRYQKNTGSQKVFFTLVDSTDHVTRETGITVTATRSLDGAAFGAATGTVTEVASGVYYLTPSAGDINADDVVYRFTGTGCDPVELHVVTY